MTFHRIAVVGGTGPQGKGLGYRFARHGHSVVLGSRAAEKAAATAEEVSARLAGVAGAGAVSGATNADACADADVVLLAVPYAGHDELVGALDAGRVPGREGGPLVREPARLRQARRLRAGRRRW